MKARAVTLFPFVPSGQNFATSIEFFAELGFENLWQHEGLAGLRFGGAYFILQDIDVPEWQTNQMITFEVDDRAAWIDARCHGQMPDQTVQEAGHD